MWGLLRELSICPDVYPQPCEYTETPDFQRKPGVGMRGAKGIRTPDLLIANETRYQLRHSPMGGFSLAQRAARVNSAGHALAAYSPPLAYSPAARRRSKTASRSIGLKSPATDSTSSDTLAGALEGRTGLTTPVTSLAELKSA